MTATRGAQEPAGATDAGSGSPGGYWGSPSPEGAEELPLEWCDPDNPIVWDYRPCDVVELPAEDVK